MSAAKPGDMYLGHLYSFEDRHVYGYITNTKIKYVVVVTSPENAMVRNSEMLQVRPAVPFA